MSEWISVKDRLPENDGEYVALIHPWNKKENQLIPVMAVFNNGDWFDSETGDDLHPPSYWIALPQMPK